MKENKEGYETINMEGNVDVFILDYESPGM